MAFSSTIVVDLASGIATGDIFIDGNLIDEIIFDNNTLTVSLSERTEATVSIDDFLKILQFFPIFNAAIIRSFFNVSQFLYTPFTPIDVQLSDNGTDTLIFEYAFTPSDVHPLFGFTSTYPSGTTVIEKRSPSTISYPQWLYYISQVSQYNLFVLNAYNL